jgi:hypothetical protein
LCIKLYHLPTHQKHITESGILSQLKYEGVYENLPINSFL